MTEHTYAIDMGALVEQFERLPFTKREVVDIKFSQQEAIGYARGRMDASEDHGLPRTGIDPLDFAASYARHCADAVENYHRGTGSTMRKDIRSAWDAFVVDGRAS